MSYVTKLFTSYILISKLHTVHFAMKSKRTGLTRFNVNV